jgi:hypothetical protein
MRKLPSAERIFTRSQCPFAVACIHKVSRLLLVLSGRSIHQGQRRSIANDLRVRACKGGHLNREVNGLTAWGLQRIAHGRERCARLSAEFENTIWRSFQIDEDMPSSNGLQNRVFGEIWSVDNGRRMANRGPCVGSKVRIVIVASADPGDAESVIGFVLPEGNTRIGTVERSAIDGLDRANLAIVRIRCGPSAAHGSGARRQAGVIDRKQSMLLLDLLQHLVDGGHMPAAEPKSMKDVVPYTLACP